MTVGMHQRWRERAADLAVVGKRALDVATGTGDLAIALAAAERRWSVDFAGDARDRPPQGPDVRFETGNALELPYGEDEFDAVTVGFGARNFADLDRGLAEMTRVTAPGGRVVVLEITPQRPPLSWFFRVWFDRVVPRLGRLAGDPDAYSYPAQLGPPLSRPERAGGEMVEAGLGEVRWILTAGGIIALHAGTKA